jgi:hypothetical protein
MVPSEIGDPEEYIMEAGQPPARRLGIPFSCRTFLPVPEPELVGMDCLDACT